MALKDTLLHEYDHEMGTTRRLLERVRDADLRWKPHAKSYSLGQLAAHLVSIPRWAAAVLESTSLDLDAVEDERFPRDPETAAPLLPAFDAAVAKARLLLNEQTDASMQSPWTLKKGAHEIFTLPKIGAIRGFVLNHSIHHRGQLSVYLRLLDIPVPSIYGPSADTD